MWKYMNMEIDPVELPTMDEVINRLKKAGGTDMALCGIRDEQTEKYGNTLIWHYPLFTINFTDGFVMPVREGILWIPYEEATSDDGEILLLDDAELLTAGDLDLMLSNFRLYADGLCAALEDMAEIAECCEEEEESNKTNEQEGE